LAVTGSAISRWRVFGTVCLAHFHHDGCGDMLYVLLPFWQSELGLDFTQIGLLKTVYSTGLAGGQIPSSRLSERLGERRLLVAGTVLMASALLALYWATVPVVFALLLLLCGLGSSVQHPLSSILISRTYAGPQLRQLLGTYNFAGDLGKVSIAVLAAVLISWLGWRGATQAIGILGLAVAAVLFLSLTQTNGADQQHTPDAPRRSTLPEATRKRGFAVLSAIGILDSATRIGFLTFMPFLLAAKGGGPAELGTAVSLTFGGGAAGKFVCGAFGARIGLVRTVILTKAGAAIAVALLLMLPLWLCILLMPLIGVMLNGTSSILYGSVPELAPPTRQVRAFGLFYTMTIGAGAVSPTVYGVIGDLLGLNESLLVLAAMMLIILPLVGLLRPALREDPS
jgi:MFS transporter, FSR family, fosmidomycin resistance protein